MSARVRFAPSPTGWLHVGGARTAYFNWLFARQRQGAFVLRVEDTDVQRSTGESESGVLADLRWLGLDWDEGPDVGGPHGPYRQSQRLDLYRARAAALVARGAAYPCFCTDDELEQRRREALAAGRPPHYDGRCRPLTEAERDARRAEGRAESIRFAVPPREWMLDDRVRGEVRFPAGMVGDFVLLRSNGLPTYNFAATVDDADMRITHVIRAEEHLANTPRQLMLYDAMGETPPAFAHVPLILNRDRSKMSKREGEVAVSVADWRRQGYVPEALLAYLVLLGFHPGDDREILSRDELLQAFSLERVGKSGSVFDPVKLRWVNARHLHHATGTALRAWIDGIAAREAGQRIDWLDGLRTLTTSLDPAMVERLYEVVHGNISTLADLPSEIAALLDATPEPDALEVLRLDRSRAVCKALATSVESLADWNVDAFKSALQSVGQRLQLKGRELFQPVRVALTGRLHGPELPMIAAILDRDKVAARLRVAASGQPYKESHE